MKNAYGVKKTDKGYVVQIYDRGFVLMCDEYGGTCYFPSEEQANAEKNRYNEFWKEN